LLKIRTTIADSLKTASVTVKASYTLVAPGGEEKLAAQDVSELLFSLASADRLTLLSEVNTRKQRLTTLAKTINASTQECSRHLARLSDAGFIKKDPDGLYETTALGKTILTLFPTIEFLLKHKDNYFLSHDLSFLPRSFIERIGELSEGEYVNHVSQVLKHIKTVISEAREYVWLISDQPIVTGMSVGKSFQSRTLTVRLIAEQITDRKEFVDAKSILPEKFEVAMLQDVQIALAINETTAGVCFPGLDGEIDFGKGFSGKDPQFRAWCCDLFEHYWARSRKIAFF
jgi:predicted transcriptional regulator